MNCDPFSLLLVLLKVSCEKIKEAMGFAVDHAESADDIVSTLRKSILSLGSSANMGLSVASIPWAPLIARCEVFQPIIATLVSNSNSLINVSDYI